MRFIIRMLPPGLAALLLGFAVAEWTVALQAVGIAPQMRVARFGEAILAIAFALAVAWTLNRALNLLLWRGLLRSPARPPVPRLLIDLSSALIYLLSLALLGEWHFQAELMAGALATSGLLVAIVGFAVRDVIADVFSGVTAQLERPYAIGDWIEFQGRTGQVVEVSWRATRLVTLDETTVVVPNGLLARQPLLNYSLPRRHFREVLRVRLDPAVPAARARRILMAAARSADGVRADPPPDVKLLDFDRQAAVYHLRFWVDDYRALQPARDAVAGAVLDHLDKAGLGFAREGSDILLHRETMGDGGRQAPEKILRRVDLFDVLDDRDVADLVAGLRLRRAAAGEVIVREGEEGASLFVLTEGLLGVEAKDPQGAPRPVGRLAPGEVFGEISLLTGHPRSATVTARTDAVLLEITAESFMPVLQRRPELAGELAAIVAGRLGRNALLAQAVPGETPHETERPLANRILGRMRGFFRL